MPAVWVPTTQTSFAVNTAIPRGSFTAGELGTMAQLVPQLTAGPMLPWAVPASGVRSKVTIAAATAIADARARPIVGLVGCLAMVIVPSPALCRYGAGQSHSRAARAC